MSRQLSEDGLWWWDGTRWQPTGAVAPHQSKGGSPWPWVAAGCGAAILLVAILGVAGFYAITHNSAFSRDYARGYARQYITDSNRRLAVVDADAQALQTCLERRQESCSLGASTLSAAASREARVVRAQTRISLFPDCLKPYATQEAAALDQLAAAAEGLNSDQVTSDLESAHNAVNGSSACEQ